MATRKKRRRKAANDPIVIYIHGIGSQPPQARLKHLWDLAIFGRDMGTGSRMAYWADILHPQKRANATASKRELSVNVDKLLDEVGVAEHRDDARAFAQSLAAAVAFQGRPPRRGSFDKKVLPLPRFLRRPIARRLINWLVKDAAAYFFNESIQNKIRKRLIQELPTSGVPFVLVSHSLGTVVAYDVLHDASVKRADAALLVTAGSPLGIQEVKDVHIEGGSLKRPRRVRSWHNFADRLDPVAIDASLDDDVSGSGRVHDHMIVNERTRELRRFNPHSAEGYLAHPRVRAVVHEAISFDTAGRFVVARDVAENFVQQGRQPVLIEVLYPGYWALGESATECAEREADQPAKLQTLPGRIDNLAAALRERVGEPARVQRLRKYVAAHLTTTEIEWLAREHERHHVYALWRSAEKRKLIDRSHAAVKVDAARASYAALGRGVVWAVLDTGARFDHPHFKTHGTILEVLDCTTDSDTPVPITRAAASDPDGHGTHVSGIIAGSSKDGRTLGLAPRAKLIVYKVLDEEGAGEDAWIIKAIDDIYRRNATGTDLQVHGVNLSLGGAFDPTVYGCGYSPICKELRDVWRQGVLVCVAAGNEGQINVLTTDDEFALNTQVSVGDPANLDDCVAVGSVHPDKPHMYGISHFSSRGPTADGRAKPDVVAPGERILSCNARFRTRGDDNELYHRSSGTSMACPHVSGLLAAFLSVRREFRGRPDEVKRILMENCNDLGRDRYHQGAGLPNLMKMLLNT